MTVESDRITLVRNPRGTAVLARNHYPHPSFNTVGTSAVLYNYFSNPRIATATGCVPTWGTGGAGTAGLMTTGLPGIWGPNANSYRMTWSATAAINSGARIELLGAALPTGGNPTSNNVSVWVRASKAQFVQLQVVGTGITPANGTGTLIPANSWARLSVNAVMTSAAVPQVRVLCPAGTGAVAWNSGDWLEASAVQISNSDAPLLFFHGAMAAAGPYSYSFSGTADASWSKRTAAGLQDVATYQNDTLIERGDTTGQVFNGAYAVQATQLRVNGLAGIEFAGLSIGSFDIATGRTYTCSVGVYVPSGVPDPCLQVAGTGVSAGAVNGASTSVKDAWTTIWVTFTTNTASGGTVLPRLRFNSPPAAGAQFWADLMMLNDGAERMPYFSGNSAADASGTYSWDGEAENSVSLRTGPDPSSVVTPQLLLGYSSSRLSQNRIHRVSGNSFPAVTLREASRRSGTFRFLFTSRDAANSAERAHSWPGVWTFTDLDNAWAGLNYVVAEGGRISLEQQDARNIWVLSIDFEQVAY